MDLLFWILLFFVAMFYASVGHGGASGYLALMGLFAFNTDVMRGSALILNIFVSGISFYHFYRAGYFRWKLFFPFAIASVPMAFLGGGIKIDPLLYKRILAVCLVFAILRIIFIYGKDDDQKRELIIIWAVLTGAFLGFFSGLIGIGGGIILSPLILLLHWGNMKESAAVSALFIFVNSCSGLLGNLFSGVEYHPQIYVLVLIAFVGGMFGSWSGARWLNNNVLRYILAGVLMIASIKLFVL